jgi:hypothetical protein
MNRRKFIKFGIGAAAVVVAGPLIKALPQPKMPAAKQAGSIRHVETMLQELWANYSVRPSSVAMSEVVATRLIEMGYDPTAFTADENGVYYLGERSRDLSKSERTAMDFAYRPSKDERTWMLPIHTLDRARISVRLLKNSRKMKPVERKLALERIYRRWPKLRQEAGIGIKVTQSIPGQVIPVVMGRKTAASRLRSAEVKHGA